MPSPEELKKKQREVQELVRKMRAEGKSDKDIKAAKQKLKRPPARFSKPMTAAERRAKFRKPTKAQQAAEAREELGRKHDVVIIPIFWKRREEEKDSVMEACAALKQKLTENKLNVWIDQRTKYTPGQKYAYWEHLGVKLRLEMGSKELKSNTVVLSQCTEPGTVAKRWSGIKTNGNLRDLLQKLHGCGLKWISVPEASAVANEHEETLKQQGSSNIDNTIDKSVSYGGGDSLEVNYDLGLDDKPKKNKNKGFSKSKPKHVKF